MDIGMPQHPKVTSHIEGHPLDDSDLAMFCEGARERWTTLHSDRDIFPMAVEFKDILYMQYMTAWYKDPIYYDWGEDGVRFRTKLPELWEQDDMEQDSCEQEDWLPTR